MNKKIPIVVSVIILLIIAGFAFFSSKNTKKQTNLTIGTKSAAVCAKAGETTGAQEMPESCCEGLKPMGGWPGGYNGDCAVPPPPTGLSICSNCGDGNCDINNGENKCNCPKDCE